MSTTLSISTFANSTYSTGQVRTARVFTDDVNDKLLLESTGNGGVDAVKISTTNATAGITGSTGTSGYSWTTQTAATGSTGGYLVKTGDATTSANSGAISISTGGVATGLAGSVLIKAGDASAAGGTAGDISLLAGSNSTDGTGGSVAVVAKHKADAYDAQTLFLQTQSVDNTLRIESKESTRDKTSIGTGTAIADRWAIELDAKVGGININAGKGLQAVAGTGDLALSSTSGSVTIGAGKDFNATATTGNVNIDSSSGNVVISAKPGTGTITLNGTVSLGASSNMNLPGDLNVAGNVTVGGTMTYLNTGTLNVDDNIITVNLNSSNSVQQDNLDGGLVMYKYPGDYIGTATASSSSLTASTVATTADGLTTVTFADSSSGVNAYKGMILKNGSEWAIVTSSTATSGGDVVLTLGGTSSSSFTISTGTSFSLYNPQTVGMVYKSAVSAFSAATLVNDGGIVLAQSNSDPGSSMDVSSYTNALCDALVVGANKDIETTAAQVGLLYFGKAKTTTGQWRLASGGDGSLRLQKWSGTAWQEKAQWS